MKRIFVAALLAAATAATSSYAQTGKENAAALRTLEAKQALRELVDRFSLLADRKEARKQTELFTEDATVQTYANGSLVSNLSGRKAIGDAFEAFLKQFDVVYHMNGQQLVAIKGETATGELYCLTYLFSSKDGQRLKTTIGVRYADEYKLVDGRWLISKRTSYFEWRTEEKVS
jgi:hypothetical protein